MLAATCLEYLLSDASPTGPCTSEGEPEERLKSDAFYEYEARSWEYHVRKAGVTECADGIAPAAAQARKLALSLLQNKMRRAAAEQAFTAAQKASGHYHNEPPGEVAGLHLAAPFGVTESLAKYLDSGVSRNVRDSHCRTPQLLAVENVHGAMASLSLVGDGVDVEDRDRDGRTPVGATASDGHCEIVRGVEQKLTFDSESDSIVVVSAEDESCRG